MKTEDLLMSILDSFIPVMDMSIYLSNEDSDDITIEISNINNKNEFPTIDVFCDNITDKKKQEYVEQITSLIKDGSIKIPHSLTCDPIKETIEYDESMILETT